MKETHTVNPLNLNVQTRSLCLEGYNLEELLIRPWSGLVSPSLASGTVHGWYNLAPAGVAAGLIIGEQWP